MKRKKQPEEIPKIGIQILKDTTSTPTVLPYKNTPIWRNCISSQSERFHFQNFPEEHVPDPLESQKKFSPLGGSKLSGGILKHLQNRKPQYGPVLKSP